MSAHSDYSTYETFASAETARKPGEQVCYYTAYVLALWVGIFLMGDVISESAPSKWAAFRNICSAMSFPDLSNVTATWRVICKRCIYRDASSISYKLNSADHHSNPSSLFTHCPVCVRQSAF